MADLNLGISIKLVGDLTKQFKSLESSLVSSLGNIQKAGNSLNNFAKKAAADREVVAKTTANTIAKAEADLAKVQAKLAKEATRVQKDEQSKVLAAERDKLKQINLGIQDSRRKRAADAKKFLAQELAEEQRVAKSKVAISKALNGIKARNTKKTQEQEKLGDQIVAAEKARLRGIEKAEDAASARLKIRQARELNASIARGVKERAAEVSRVTTERRNQEKLGDQIVAAEKARLRGIEKAEDAASARLKIRQAREINASLVQGAKARAAEIAKTTKERREQEKRGDQIVAANKKRLNADGKLDPRNASDFLKALGRATASIEGPLSGVSGRINAFATVLRTVPAPLAAMVFGINLIVNAAKAMVTAAIEMEISLFRIQGVLKATGSAAGITSEQVNQMSISLAEATLASTNGVRQAAAALLTFRDVSGESFEKVLGLAQDLTSVLGGNLRTNITKLGRAFQDPTRAIVTLRRAGVSFSVGQTELIKNFQRLNNLTGAQGVLLEVLSEQFGGAAVAEAQGLAGAVDTLGERFGVFFELVATNTGLTSGLTRLVNLLSSAAAGLGLLASTNSDLSDEELGKARAELLVKGITLQQEITEAISRQIGLEKQLTKAIQDGDKASQSRIKTALTRGVGGIRGRQNSLDFTVKELQGLDFENARRGVDKAAAKAKSEAIQAEIQAQRDADLQKKLRKQSREDRRRDFSTRIAQAKEAATLEAKGDRRRVQLGELTGQQAISNAKVRSLTIISLEQSKLNALKVLADNEIAKERKAIASSGKAEGFRTKLLVQSLKDRQDIVNREAKLALDRRRVEAEAVEQTISGLEKLKIARAEVQDSIDELAPTKGNSPEAKAIEKQISELQKATLAFGTVLSEGTKQSIEAQISQLTSLAEAQRVVDDVVDQITQNNNDLAQKIKGLKAQVRLGARSRGSVEREALDLTEAQDRANLRLLDSTLKLVEAGGNTKAAKQIREMIDGIVVLTDKTNLLGQQITTSMQEPINNALNNLINGVDTLADSIDKLVENIARAIQRIAVQRTVEKAFGFASGGLVRTPAASGSFASGGLITGPGTGTSDSISARLSNFEYVMPAAITKQFLPVLEIMRQGKFEEWLGGRQPGKVKPLIPTVPRFRDGGLAVASSQTQAGIIAPVSVTIVTPNPSSFQRSEAVVSRRIGQAVRRATNRTS